GFFYSRYPEPEGGNPKLAVNQNHTLYYHRLGQDQSRDLVVYARPDQPDWGIGATVSDDGRYLILSLWLGTDRRNRIYYLDLGDPAHPRFDGQVVPLLDAFDAGYAFVGNDGPLFYVSTDWHSPRGQVVAIDTRTPARESWKTVLPQTDDVLESVRIVRER